jgi:hypothetical protein
MKGKSFGEEWQPPALTPDGLFKNTDPAAKKKQ